MSAERETPETDVEKIERLERDRDEWASDARLYANALSDAIRERDELREALIRLRNRFRSLQRTAEERRNEADERGETEAAQEHAIERSVYIQAAMECTLELDALANTAPKGEHE